VGTVMVDNVSISDDKPEPKDEPKPVAPQKQLTFTMTSGGVKALFTETETPEITLTITDVPKDMTMELQFDTVDYFGRKVKTQKAVKQLKAGADYTETLTFPELKLPGFYCTTAIWKIKGSDGAPTVENNTGSTQASFVKVGPKPDTPDSLFGISVFAGNDAERYSLMGVGTKGIYFSWRDLEDANGKLDLEKTRADIKALQSAGIKLIGHFSTVSSGRIPRRYLKKKVEPKQDPIENPSIYFKDYQEFVHTVVSEFKNDIHEWAASGEINLLAYQGDYIRQRYIDDVKTISRGIRSADPTATYVALGCSGADGRQNPRYPFLKGLLPAIVDDIDGFGIDQYTAGQTYGKGYVNKNSEEGQIREMMLEALKIAHENGKTYVSIEEKGASIIRKTPLDSPLGIRMANIVARDFIILKTVPEVRHWLYFRPDNWQKDSVIDYGLWEKNNPRQAVAAFAATARIMAHAKFIKDKVLCEDIPCWIFSKDGGAFATLWYNGAEPLKFQLPATYPATVNDVQGNTVQLDDATMILTDAPQYLHADSLEHLEELLDNAKYTVPELGTAIEVIAENKMQLALRNFSGKAFKARIVEFSSSPEQTLPPALREDIELSPNETRIIDVPFAPAKCSFTLETSNGQRLTASRTFSPCRIKRVNGWEELAKTQPIIVNEASKQMPGYDDLKANKIYTGPDDLSIVARLGYDDSFFYMEYVVKDDVHVNEQTPARSFASDCVQYAFDTRKDARIKWLNNIQGFTEDDYNFVSALASGTPVTFCHLAATENRERLANKQLDSPTILRDDAAGTTTYRIALPFKDIAPLTPTRGLCFGFSFLAFDTDKNRDKLIWIQASPGITNPSNPADFIECLLE
ncbi:MAG: hypothetical protein J6X55_11345, partial [Victivallales bacterium]|nr:hypothetical protein [Victivallales bacterium]